MLLREFTIDNHTISLIQNDDIYVTAVVNGKGEKLYYHEYKDYEKIKSCFDEIIQTIEADGVSIEQVINILEKSTI